ncbi:MAG: sigma-70 family RNA polymerase sigma factor [Bacteroidetes bacterium]|nr:sigma-70 family RNA polymerase sigma factor [Bacteroidota bacterium]
MSAQDDSELIKQFLAGDEKAFNLLVYRYQERVYWLVRRIVVDHDSANDVVQDVFIKVHSSLKGFKGESSLYTWLYRIALNFSFNELRKRKIRQSFSIEQDEIDIESEDESPEKFVISNEYKKIIEEAIKTLPEKQRKVFILRYYEEMPFNEISKLLKTSVGGLKANYFHALKKIGKYVKSKM